MDWFLDSGDGAAFRRLRHDADAYFRRHAAPGSDVDAANLAFSELVTNAFVHTVGPAWVTLDWTADRPLLTVRDLGPGFALEDLAPPTPSQERGRGLFLASHMTSALRVAKRRARGSLVTALLPVVRQVERTHRPRPEDPWALPAPEEASDDGTFAREAFLRALVVQLSQAVEAQEGPDSAEAVVAQVGTDVGGRMEAEYRRVRGLTERLSPEQMADLYVRLKRAIEGDFYVIEATEERIVLGNRRCPFGDIVQRSPALCRMTSSVFGGIAARNRGRSAVQLEERIAVGDPGCRVVVWLGEGSDDAGGSVHRYRSVESRASDMVESRVNGP